ncbi:MAG: glycosyltransferase family 4 protein, partial [Gemmatimonadaceae bacterium]|nr:glycosyltransferase family 4 protein [Gemmatimonadaceae bacterium]
MRVALASWTIRHAGGIESYLEQIIPAMRATGLDVAFFHEVDQPSDRARIDIGDVPLFSVASNGADAALTALRAWKPDVLYMHGLSDTRTFQRLTALGPSVSFIHTYSGTCISGSKTHTRPNVIPCSKRFGAMCLVHYFPRGCGGRNPVTMWELYRKEQQQLATLQRQSAVVTHSAHMQRELAAHGVAADVIPFAIHSRDTSGDPNATKSCDIIFAGRMDYVKGGLLLLDAAQQIRRELNRSLRVVFAGDGPDRRLWESRGATISKEDPEVAVEFAGWCDEARLGMLMGGTRLLVVPSVWPEPFGSVGMAAARLGVPAAAFAVGGIPQWLHDGVNGHLASASPPTAAGLAGAVVKCLQDPQHYEELSRGARQMAAHFTMERHLP